jgi:hypothetical protein
VKILEIDSERRRLSLSAKRVEDQVLPLGGPRPVSDEPLDGEVRDLGLSEDVFADADAPAAEPPRDPALSSSTPGPEIDLSGFNVAAATEAASAPAQAEAPAEPEAEAEAPAAEPETETEAPAAEAEAPAAEPEDEAPAAEAPAEEPEAVAEDEAPVAEAPAEEPEAAAAEPEADEEAQE